MAKLSKSLYLQYCASDLHAVLTEWDIHRINVAYSRFGSFVGSPWYWRVLIPFFFRTAVSYAAVGRWRAVTGAGAVPGRCSAEGGAVPGAVWCQERGYRCGAGFRALFASTLSPPVYARRLPKTRLQSHVSGRNAVREMSPQRRLRLFTGRKASQTPQLRGCHCGRLEGGSSRRSLGETLPKSSASWDVGREIAP